MAKSFGLKFCVAMTIFGLQAAWAETDMTQLNGSWSVVDMTCLDTKEVHALPKKAFGIMTFETEASRASVAANLDGCSGSVAYDLKLIPEQSAFVLTNSRSENMICEDGANVRFNDDIPMHIEFRKELDVTFFVALVPPHATMECGPSPGEIRFMPVMGM